MTPLNSHNPFKVLFTADFFNADGKPKFSDIGLNIFTDHTHVQKDSFAEHLPEIAPSQIGNAQGVIALTPSVTANSLSQADELLAIARFGVGYDNTDVNACTEADVLLSIAIGAVDRPVAEATIGWMIALTHHFRTKDQLVRTGQWDARVNYHGCELRDRTLGIVGLGGIGRKVVKLLQGFGMNQPIAFDPFADASVAKQFDVRMVKLDELLRTADFVSIHCPLSDATHNLIDADQIALMRPEAYLLNTARGGIVNEDALYEALQQGRIAGAAVDCFVGEPITHPHRLGELENVLLAPHSIAWTHELFRDIGQMACQGMVKLSIGKEPRGIVNREVLERKSFQEKWQRLIGRDGE